MTRPRTASASASLRPQKATSTATRPRRTRRRTDERAHEHEHGQRERERTSSSQSPMPISTASIIATIAVPRTNPPSTSRRAGRHDRTRAAPRDQRCAGSGPERRAVAQDEVEHRDGQNDARDDACTRLHAGGGVAEASRQASPVTARGSSVRAADSSIGSPCGWPAMSSTALQRDGRPDSSGGRRPRSSPRRRSRAPPPDRQQGERRRRPFEVPTAAEPRGEGRQRRRDRKRDGDRQDDCAEVPEQREDERQRRRADE